MNTRSIDILKGLIISYVITFIVFCLFSILYSFTNLNDDFLCPIVRVTEVISIAIGAIISCKNINSRGWLSGIIIGFLYTAVMIILGVFLENASQPKFEILSINLGLGSFSGIIGVNRKRKRNN